MPVIPQPTRDPISFLLDGYQQQLPDQQAAGQMTDNQMAEAAADAGASNPINWDAIESQGQAIQNQQPTIDANQAAWNYYQQQLAAQQAAAAQAQAQYQAQINQQMAIEQAKLAEQGREFNQKQVGDFADTLMKEKGPADPYSYLFNSAGLAAPRGYNPEQLALPQAVIDAYKTQGIDLSQLQNYLTGGGRANPMIAGYLGGLNQNAFNAASQMSPLAQNAVTATQVANPMATQPQAQAPAQQSALLGLLASHPNADQFIASHPQFPQMIASHPQYTQAQNPVQQQNPVAMQPVQPPVPVGSSGTNPIGSQFQAGKPSKEPDRIANLVGGVAPDTSTAKPPINLDTLDPYTKSLVNAHGIPGAPSAYQLANMPPSAVSAYTDYVNNIAGGNMNDLMDKAKAMFPVAGAAQATNYQGPVQ